MYIHDDSTIRIRVAATDDAAALLKIYAPYVTDTVITFEYDVPTVEEFAGRISDTLEKHPYLVMEERAAEEGDWHIIGYAYAGTFKGRAAYDWAVETTIYLADEAKGRGLGRKLYDALEETLKTQNILNVCACIGYPEVEDEYLTKNSAEFHAHMGYRMVGEFRQCGYKFGRWYNMVWMEKFIGDHGADPAPVIPFSQLPCLLKKSWS